MTHHRSLRSFLRFAAITSLSATWLLGLGVRVDSQATSPGSKNYLLAQKRPFVTPPEIRTSEDVLATVLEVRFADNRMGSYPIYHRSYNGRLVGPTLRVKPGCLLKVRLRNRLPRTTVGKPSGANDPHGFNVTNLHTHGLHVSPEADSDNVFLKVAPGQSKDFSFVLPHDHKAGTFWYHAHKHGAVALQLSSGMAGALICEGELDYVPEIRAAKERICVLQQILFEKSGRGEINVDEVYSDNPDPDKVNTATSINGVFGSTFEMAPGEVERWRFVHAGLAETISLAVVKDAPGEPKSPLHEIALDGLATGTILSREIVELQPGNRADVLFKAPMGPGTYFIISDETEAVRSITERKQPKRYLARVVVRGTAKPMNLPRAAQLEKFRIPSIEDDELTGESRSIEFYARNSTGQFEINGKEFDPNRVDIRPELGTAEEWTLSSKAGIHPFHIHVNPFEVIRTDPTTGKEVREWRDTVVVSDGDLNPVKIRMRYETFAGKAVLHCHNLRHEDKGMMTAIEFLHRPSSTRNRSPNQARGGFPQLPVQAPKWTLLDRESHPHRLDDGTDRGLVLIFIRGVGCTHCVEQLHRFDQFVEKFRRKGLRVVAITPDSVTDLLRGQTEDSRVRQLGIPLLSDADSAILDRYHCLIDDFGEHGIFLIDRSGRVRWQKVSRNPFDSPEYILGVWDRIEAKR